ncbi:hypothetical protein TEA_012876 [Camellia sinensis var. sinensis]|uniref:Uncharacterized protein n=1 Tax=Camellia sinensis var. sinensis TaxID=542762 RepID=A0A4S4DPR0_CAMSN|nr:hypothetical protein TEA_012876 [Camellia sinensis var. sinensis]
MSQVALEELMIKKEEVLKCAMATIVVLEIVALIAVLQIMTLKKKFVFVGCNRDRAARSARGGRGCSTPWRVRGSAQAGSRGSAPEAKYKNAFKVACPLERRMLSSKGLEDTSKDCLFILYKRESCSSVDSEEFELETLVDSRVAYRQDNSEVKTGLEEAHRGCVFASGTKTTKRRESTVDVDNTSTNFHVAVPPKELTLAGAILDFFVPNVAPDTAGDRALISTPPPTGCGADTNDEIGLADTSKTGVTDGEIAHNCG